LRLLTTIKPPALPERYDWNNAENIVRFVRLSDTGTTIAVELYLTAEDAQAQTNLKASGESKGYGNPLKIVLTSELGASIALFQEGYGLACDSQRREQRRDKNFQSHKVCGTG